MILKPWVFAWSDTSEQSRGLAWIRTGTDGWPVSPEGVQISGEPWFPSLSGVG